MRIYVYIRICTCMRAYTYVRAYTYMESNVVPKWRPRDPPPDPHPPGDLGPNPMPVCAYYVHYTHDACHAHYTFYEYYRHYACNTCNAYYTYYTYEIYTMYYNSRGWKVVKLRWLSWQRSTPSLHRDRGGFKRSLLDVFGNLPKSALGRRGS